MTATNDDSTHDSILYEVLEYFTRKQEPELTKFKSDPLVLPTPGTIKNALRYLNNRYSLPEIISQQISYTLPWKFAIGDKGRILAILQENIIEIRKSKDEYSSIVGKASAPKDSFPQWRKLLWSPDGSILALASSNGYVSFYNSFGNNIFNISPKSVSLNPHILEAGDATASMIFKKPRVKSEKWEYEFIRVTYSGLLKSYCICGNAFSENHNFSFGSFYRNGVNCVSYSEKYNLFFVAGNSVSQNITCTAAQIGLTCWRTLNDHPYYKLSISSEDNEIYKSHFSIWNFIPVIINRAQSIIFKISISPNDLLISCLHTDGTISIWSSPTLKLQKQWKLFEQPNYNILNPLKSMKLKKCLTSISEFQPLDIGWWSNNAVIIARYSGSISVCSINNLKNLLGTSPEFLYNHPQIAELNENKGFLCLDCEVLVTSIKRNRESSSEGHLSELSSDSEKDEDESKPTTILNYTTNLMQSALYSITDIEKFQPKRKKSKVFHRTYRLLGLKSTTPEELYSRKIEIEEYEEALELASTYNLDPDLVYQTQWRKSEFSVNAIQENLSKVSKRSWVLNECISRVPETLEATRELLNFGLHGANLETLIAIGTNDNGKFTSAEENNENDDESSVELKKMQRINQILETVAKDTLTESQKELIRYRKKLLDHLDKLQTYEILLESSSKFDKKFYEEFRHLSPIENAIKFAKSGNCRGVEVMFTYYELNLIPHWLTIISFFPETLNPENYRKLLPECDIEGQLFLLYQQELRPKDWIERNIFSDIIKLENNHDLEFIYENRKSLLAYRNKELTQDLLQNWYKSRAYEIEHDSRLVDNALSLINIGKSHNIGNLEKLLFELETLDDLVYKVGLEDLSLIEVEKLTDLEKIKLLMSNSEEKNFVSNIKSMLLPFSRRRKRYLGNTLDKDLLYDYLVYLSKTDLKLPAIFFESLKVSYDPEILDIIESITSLAIDCIYVCTDIEVYSKAKAIFDSTITYASGREDSNKKYKEIEKELKCLQILNKYEVKIPFYQIKESKENSTDARTLFVQMSENLINIYPQLSEKNWSQMLSDMLDIQKLIFSCLDIETCFEITMMTRLNSGSKTTIQGCANLMELKKNGRSHLKVSYERAIDIILQASNNYFNNSNSLTDPDMELAKECLYLVTNDDERIKEEYDLIESLQILNEFNILILPLQVRNTRERLKLIEDCLNSRNDAYKNKQKLINLSKYLRIEQKNNRIREGKVLNLIAKKAFEMKDYNFSSSIIKQMMENNYQSAWNVALDLAYCDDYNDLQFRRNCIWFAINNVPSSMIESLMKRANLLQIQILNSDLDKWIPSENENLNEKKNVDNGFADVFSTLQTENKELVPKIVQTSTELMKNSAQIVKQSTFDLIRNAGNTDYWKTKLNFNFSEKTEKVIANDEIIIKEKQMQLPKFPCFYEALYKDCIVGDFGTKYCKYSLDGYNAQFKLYQTLLRISLLSETASYGAEVSDVNHLLLKCAEYIITEDCTMGLSYLLHIQDNNLQNFTNIFENLPQTNLYSQIFAYFCSIKLYSSMGFDPIKVFLYDPIQLIQSMLNTNIKDNDEYKKTLKKLIILSINDEQDKNNVTKKMISENSYKFESQIISNDDFNKVNLEVENALILNTVDAAEEIGDWGNWGDDWSDTSNLVFDNIKESINDTDSLESFKNFISMENNHEVCDERFSKIHTLDEYRQMKQILLQWSNLKDTKYNNDILPNLALKMIIKIVNIGNFSEINNETLFQEIKDLLHEDLIPQSAFINFIRQKKDFFTAEQLIYLQLCSKDSSLQYEAVDYIKNNYNILTLTSSILEEIFFNNLTSSFSVTHDLYYRILEDVFINRTLPEVEDNMKLLIENLVQQKNIPHAIALLNQLEGIPPSLSTYENCFKLLLRK